MKKIYLHRGAGTNCYKTDIYVMVDEVDFDKLNEKKWFILKSNRTVYAVRYPFVDGNTKSVLMHRELLGLVSSDIFCDHKDLNGLNNTRSNIRVATKSQNQSNIISRPNSTSRYLGVYKQGHSWITYTQYNNKRYYGGSFISEDIAALKYNEIALSVKGEYARLNIIRWY